MGSVSWGSIDAIWIGVTGGGDAVGAAGAEPPNSMYSSAACSTTLSPSPITKFDRFILWDLPNLDTQFHLGGGQLGHHAD